MSVHRRWGNAVRWGACLLLAFGIHAAGAMALLARWHPDGEAVASGPVVLVDFAPAPAAPARAPSELPPGPPQPQAQAEELQPPAPVTTATIEPEPEPQQQAEKVEPEPAPQAPTETIEAMPAPEPTLSVMPPPRPTKKLKEQAKTAKPHRQASLASAPSTAARQAARAVAPAPGAGARDRHALPNWTSQLVARLERYKRYPAAAQARGEHGVARLAFSVDRSGRVHDARILRSSGSVLLDRATLALVQRAQPLPPPPAGVPGARIPIVVPIRYHVR